MKRDWITIASWTWIALFVLWKLYLLIQGQSLASWLDVTNPSLFGLLFTLCVVVLIVRAVRKRGVA